MELIVKYILREKLFMYDYKIVLYREYIIILIFFRNDVLD